MFPPKCFPPVWGMLRRFVDAFRFFFKKVITLSRIELTNPYYSFVKMRGYPGRPGSLASNLVTF